MAATTTRTIEVRITGEDAGATKALDRVGGAVASLGNVAIGVAAGGLAVFIAGLGAVGTIAFDAALDFDNASKKIQASMGLLPKEAEKFDKIIEQVYRDNFGDSIDDVGQSVTTVGLKLKTLGIDSENAITSATENALSLRDAFDVDVSESIGAASELVRTGLVDNFDEAFDLITSGFQQGLNSSDDFLDSISEYSTQFAELDATGSEFFSALKTGLAGGVLGTDKIGDAFKEFRLRILDGSDATSEAVTALEDILGVPAEEFLDGIASGQIRGVDAAQQLVNALSKVENEEERLAVGAALFGTQFEDLGDTTLAAVNIMESGMDDLAGATESLNVQYDTLGSAMEGLKRIGILALKPIGDILLGLANEVMPLLKSGMEALGPVIDTVVGAFEDLSTGDIMGLAELIGFDEAASVLASVFHFKDAIKELAKTIFGDLVPGGVDIKSIVGGAFKFLADDVLPPLTKAIRFVSDHWDEFKGAILGVGAALAGAGIVTIIAAVGSVIAGLVSPIGAIIALAALLGAAWAGDWGGIRTTIMEVWESTIKPALFQLQEWLSEKIPEAMKKLSAWWDTNWPTIAATLLTVWAIIKGVFDAIVSAVGGTIVPNLTSAFDSITEALNKMGINWGDIFNAVWEATKIVFIAIGAIILGLIAVVVGLATGISEAVAWMTSSWTELVGGVMTLITGLIQFFVGAFEIIAGIFTLDGARIAKGFALLWKGIKNNVKGIWKIIISIISGAVGGLLMLIWGFVEGVIKFFTDLANSLVGNSIIPDMVMAIIASFNQMVEDVINLVIGWVTEIIAMVAQFVLDLLDLWEKGWESVAQAVSDTKESIITAVNKIISAIKALFTVEKFKAIGKKITDGIKKGIEAGKEAVKLKVGEIVTAIQTFFTIEKFKSLGTNIANGLKQGLSESKAALIEFIKGIAGDMIQAVKDMFGIESPSKVFVGIGEDVNRGLAMGIAASSGIPAQAIQNTASSVVNNTTNIFNQTINGGVPSAGREFEIMRSEAVAFGS